MKRVVLSGGTGFVGANLVRRLLDDGDEVHLLVRPGFLPWRINGIIGDVILHECVLSDAASMDAVISGVRPESCFHLAVYGAYPSQRDWRQMVRTNIEGTVNLFEACSRHGCEAFVNTGTSSEYGYKNHAPPEDEYIEPNSSYAVTKAAATHYTKLLAHSSPMRVSTLRLYSAYGSFEEPSRLIPTLVVRALAGELPPLVDPSIARDFVHVSDVCAAYLAAANQPVEEKGAVYNIGTGSQTTLFDIVNLVRRMFNIAAEPQWNSVAARTWDSSTWVAAPAKAQRALRWEPAVNLEKGLTELRDWFAANPAMLEFYRTASG